MVFTCLLVLVVVVNLDAILAYSRISLHRAKLNSRSCAIQVLNNDESESIISGNLHASYLKNIALIDVPARLPSLLKLLVLQGDEIVSPRSRSSLNPFLIPISKRKSDGSYLCYIRWPTQKPSMELQLVRTTETGIRCTACRSAAARSDRPAS